MQTQTFAQTQLTVSELCFGCWGITGDSHWGERDEQESLSAMTAAVDCGVNFFDTAPVYGNGASEELLGRFVQQNQLRSQLVIASKVRPDLMTAGGVVKSCEDSLARLQTDVIDIYQTHWTSSEVPLEETWQGMQRLLKQGKVRQIGVCNAGVKDLAVVGESEPPATNQLPLNLLWRMIETDILPACEAKKTGVLAYSPLMHGLLAGKYDSAESVPDGRARSRHFSGQRSQARHGEAGCEVQTFQAIDAIRKVAENEGRSMASISLAWVNQQPGVASVIAGAKNAEQLRQNVEALNQPLSEQVLQQLVDVTADLKNCLGSNPDMWDGGKQARYR